MDAIQGYGPQTILLFSHYLWLGTRQRFIPRIFFFLRKWTQQTSPKFEHADRIFWTVNSYTTRTSTPQSYFVLFFSFLHPFSAYYLLLFFKTIKTWKVFPGLPNFYSTYVILFILIAWILSGANERMYTPLSQNYAQTHLCAEDENLWILTNFILFLLSLRGKGLALHPCNYCFGPAKGFTHSSI